MYKMVGFAGLGVLLSLIYLLLIGFAFYCLILFIRLANRGIKALDIYINKNSGIFPPGGGCGSSF